MEKTVGFVVHVFDKNGVVINMVHPAFEDKIVIDSVVCLESFFTLNTRKMCGQICKINFQHSRVISKKYLIVIQVALTWNSLIVDIELSRTLTKFQTTTRLFSFVRTKYQTSRVRNCFFLSNSFRFSIFGT